MKILRLLLLTAAIAFPPVAQADLFDSYLDDVSTRLDGGGNRSADGDRRGYLTGGNVRIRFQGSKFRNSEIYRVTAPSWDLGCGGVDLHLGAFSHISSDAFVEMLKSLIGPEMLAYAFKLALGQFCEDCASLMAELEARLNQFNEMFKMSCEERGRAVFEAAGRPAGQFVVDKLKQWGVTDSDSDKDIASNDADPDLPKQQLASAPEKTKGNIIFNFIKDRDLSQDLGLPLTESQLRNLVLSFMGTHLIVEGQNDPTTKSGPDGTPGAQVIPPALDSIMPLLRGGSEITGIVCDSGSSDCTELEKKATILEVQAGETLKDRLVEKFSSGTPNSIIDRFMFHQDGIELDPEDRKIVALLGRYSTLNTMIYNVVASGNGWPQMFADAAADIIAVELAMEFVKDVAALGRDIAQEVEQQQMYIDNIEKTRQLLLRELETYRVDSRDRLATSHEIILNASKRQL